MSAKRTKAPAQAADDLGDLFDGIGNDPKAKKPAPKAGSKPAPASAASKTRPDSKPQQDILADLENELGQESRPHTPRVKDKDAATASKRTSTATPPPASVRQSEDRPAASRRSVEVPRDADSDAAPASAPAPAAASGGGWWGGVGGIFATASATANAAANAAMKQAEAAYKEIQQNEEAKKWADQVRGNIGALQGLGDDLRHRALPTFSEIINTLAPPISSHERLLIHITHDIAGYPSLDPLIYGVFNRVMSQVEGGDLLVIQRGQEQSQRRASSSSSGPATAAASSAGWRDGPWWRQSDVPRDLGSVRGLVEGTKLCRVSAETYASEFFAASGSSVEAAQKRAVEPDSADDANPVRTSDIFLAVQAIRLDGDATLFAGSSVAAEADKGKGKAEAGASSGAKDPQVCFAIYVFDPVHEISYSTVTQALPARWTDWLDSKATASGSNGDDDEDEDDEDEDEDEDDEDEDDEDEEEDEKASATAKSAKDTAATAVPPELASIPAEIRDIVATGGVDPREWVAEWVEETLSLGIGAIAQRYVARRMGVGEAGGLGKGARQKVEALVQDGGGEAARAGLI